MSLHTIVKLNHFFKKKKKKKKKKNNLTKLEWAF